MFASVCVFVGVAKVFKECVSVPLKHTYATTVLDKCVSGEISSEQKNASDKAKRR